MSAACVSCWDTLNFVLRQQPTDHVTVLYEPDVSYQLQLPSEGRLVAAPGILCTGKGHMRHQGLTAQSARSRGLHDD
jgi:hypothetical protein